MTGSPADPADFVIRAKHRLWDLGISVVSCFLFIVALGPAAGLMWFAVLFIHELGHFTFGYVFTGRPPAIVIYPFVGLTLAPGMIRRSTQANIAFGLGGIWISIVIALPLLLFARQVDLVLAFLGLALLINLINVLPIPGLDGGRVCLMIARTLPPPWPMVVGILLFALSIVFAWWLKDPLFWVFLGFVALMAVLVLRKGARLPFAPLAPRDAGAWFAAYLFTVTLVGHALWIVASEPRSVERVLGVLRL